MDTTRVQCIHTLGTTCQDITTIEPKQLELFIFHLEKNVSELGVYNYTYAILRPVTVSHPLKNVCHINQLFLIPYRQNITNFSKIHDPDQVGQAGQQMRTRRKEDFAKITDILSMWYKDHLLNMTRLQDNKNLQLKGPNLYV